MPGSCSGQRLASRSAPEADDRADDGRGRAAGPVQGRLSAAASTMPRAVSRSTTSLAMVGTGDARHEFAQRILVGRQLLARLDDCGAEAATRVAVLRRAIAHRRVQRDQRGVVVGVSVEQLVEPADSLLAAIWSRAPRATSSASLAWASRSSAAGQSPSPPAAVARRPGRVRGQSNAAARLPGSYRRTASATSPRPAPRRRRCRQSRPAGRGWRGPCAAGRGRPASCPRCSVKSAPAPSVEFGAGVLSRR